jgi:hypothetical protein
MSLAYRTMRTESETPAGVGAAARWLAALLDAADAVWRTHRGWVIAALLVAAVLQSRAALPKMGEFNIQYNAAVRTLSGEIPYRRTDHYYFTYPPAVLFLYAPFTRLPLRAAKEAWCAVAVALLAWNVVLSGRMTALRPSPGVLLVAALCTVRHLTNNLMRGQITPLIFVAILLAWVFDARDRPGRAGVAMAVAIHTKLYPGIAAILFVLRARWRTVAATLAAVLALFVLPVVFFPLGTYPHVLAAWLDLALGESAHGCFHKAMNQSIAAFFYRLLTADRNHVAIVHLPSAVPLVLTVATHVAAFATTAILVRRAEAVVDAEARALARAAAASMLLIYLAVAVPCSHKYNLLAEVPGYVTLLCAFRREPAGRVAAVVVGSTLVSYVAALRPLGVVCADLWSAAIVFVGCALVARDACRGPGTAAVYTPSTNAPLADAQ